MKYDYPNYALKSDFTPGTFSENEWKPGEIACVERAFYVLPDGEEFAFFKFSERTYTGRKKVRWEEYHNGRFSNNYFDCDLDRAAEWMEGYIAFWGFPKGRYQYRVDMRGNRK